MTPILDRDAARRLAIGLFIGFVVLELVALTGIAKPPHAELALQYPFYFEASAFGAAYVLHISSQRFTLKRVGIELLFVAAAYGGLWLWSRPDTFGLAAALLAEALGFVAIGASIVSVVRNRGEQRAGALSSLVGVLSLRVFLLYTSVALALTVCLHPITRDGAAYHLDSVLVRAPAFAVSRFVHAVPGLFELCLVVYVGLPVVIALVHVAERRSVGRPRVDTLTLCVLAGLLGFSLYHACPVAGPRFLFGDDFPANPPPVQGVPFEAVMREFSSRNSIPSLHTTWALLLAFRCARLGTKIRIASLFFVVITLLATMGLGEHFAIDLVAAVPFTIAIDAATTTEVPLEDRARWIPIVGGSFLLLTWILVVRNAAPWLEMHRGLYSGFLMTSVALPFFMRHELRRRVAALAEVEAPETTAPAPEPSPAPSAGRRGWIVGIMFFSSGFAGLVYEVVFGKGLALTFGSTAQASLTVLATYMGGMALGSWLGGRIAAGRRDALRVYAFAELGIGLWCAASPWMLGAARAVYVAIAEGQVPGRPMQSVLQLALGSVVLLPATVLMGVTMPVLARYVEEDEAGLARAVGLLYGANTFGAAAGALLTGYVVLPRLGLSSSTWAAVMLNLFVSAAGFGLAHLQAVRAFAAASREGPEKTASGSISLEHKRSILTPAPPRPSHPLDRGIAVAVLAGGGAVTLALEVAYTHLLAVVAGNSAYAFSLMLFSFLVGLGLGAAVMRSFLRGREARLWHVGVLEICVGAAVLAGVFIWDGIPSYFASFAEVPFTQGFGPREFVRFAVCAVAMIPPAFFIGALYPAAIACAARGHAHPVAALGRAAALNTVGNIVGAIGASFVLLPALGSLHTVQALALSSVALGLLPLASPRGRTLAVPIAAAAAVMLFVVNPRTFDLTALASGGNVYFSPQRDGRVIDSAESVSGGLTTVEVSADPDDDNVKTMLTNGKFQGDDSPNREVRAQYAFALVPLLHTAHRDRALVVGFGVGGSTRALRDAGFGRVDVAELSPDVLRLANKHFGRVNHGVLKDKKVHPYIADGRNFLLLHDGDYQLITVEISSIWFAGAAALYNREFYQLAKEHLAPDGVFQQWVQLHHMSQKTLTSILATVHAEFPFVYVYVTAAQGQIVACTQECSPPPEALAAIQNAPGLQDAMELFDGTPETLLSGLVIDGKGIERLIRRRKAVFNVSVPISTDDNLYLEYATPRGNALSGDPAPNIDYLRLGSKPIGRRKQADLEEDD